MPDRLGTADEPVPGGERDQRTAREPLPPRRRRAPSDPRGPAHPADRPALARPAAVLRVHARRQRRRHRRQPPDRLDRHDRGAPAALPGRDRPRDQGEPGSGSPRRGKRHPGSRGNGGDAMTGWPDRPVIYEVNTAVWLAELARAAGAPVTLGGVAGSDWDAITPAGADAVWLMGVWERSPAGLELAKANPDLLESFREALPDLREQDIIGSPYCVHRYVADERFGGPAGLAAARAALAARGVRLILDYVPNHVAPDHPWVTEHPEFFIQGDEDDVKADPAGWLRVGGHVVAHGRDPYFPPWPDVVQLNAFAAPARAATAATLTDIADQCDGIRCDMAMLMFNDIFAKTWGSRARSSGCSCSPGCASCSRRPC